MRDHPRRREDESEKENQRRLMGYPRGANVKKRIPRRQRGAYQGNSRLHASTRRGKVTSIDVKHPLSTVVLRGYKNGGWTQYVLSAAKKGIPQKSAKRLQRQRWKTLGEAWLGYATGMFCPMHTLFRTAM